MLGPLILLVVTGIGLTLAILAGAMALGMLGTGLFAVGDRAIAWFQKNRRWPEE
jgi:hypothetical protein